MRVVVQQRQRLLRDGLATLLDLADDVAVVGTVQCAEDLVELCERSRADVAVVDIDGGGLGPLPPLATLRKRLPDLVVVAVHRRHRSADVERVRRTGIATIAHEDGIVAVLRAVRAGPVGLSPEGAPRVPTRVEPSLTRREAHVLNLVAGGRTSREISRALRVSHKTVDNHKQRVFAKLGVQNQAHAVSLAIRHGMIAPDPRASVAAPI